MAIGRTSSPADIMELSDKLSLAAHQVYGGAVRVAVFVRPLSNVARPSMATEQRGLSAGIVVFAIIAILNYALLGIGEARRRGQEFAIRVAFGATRRQVASRFLIEQLRLIGMAALATLVVFMIGRAAFPANDVFLPSIGLVPGSIWVMIAAAFSILVLAAALPSRIASGTGEAETLRQVAARSSRFERTWNRVIHRNAVRRDGLSACRRRQRGDGIHADAKPQIRIRSERRRLRERIVSYSRASGRRAGQAGGVRDRH